MNTTTYTITLTDEQRTTIDNILNNPQEDSKILLRANILKLSDSKNGQIVPVARIAELVGTSRQTVTKIRNIYNEQGFDIALHILDRKGYESCKENDVELLERIKEIINEPPKSGRSKWSIRTLCSECIERGYVKYISPPTMLLILQKNNIQL